jgi:hypothetical protein
LPKYKLKSGSHSIHRVDQDALNYNAGDILELTKEQAAAFDPGRLEEITATEAKQQEAQNATTQDTAASTASTATVKGETEWTAVLSQGVMDVRAAVAALDNPDDLKALQKEEEKGSNRKMVMEAIEKRLGELKK